MHASCPWGTIRGVAHGRHSWACGLSWTPTLQLDDIFFDILVIQRSRVVVFFLFVYFNFVSSRTLSHMTPNMLFSRPICENCYCALLNSFSSTMLLTSITISRKKKFQPKFTKICTRMLYKTFLVRKRNTFRHSQPTYPPMYVSKISWRYPLIFYSYFILFVPALRGKRGLNPATGVDVYH